jgi:hypothetical protein
MTKRLEMLATTVNKYIHVRLTTRLTYDLPVRTEAGRKSTIRCIINPTFETQTHPTDSGIIPFLSRTRPPSTAGIRLLNKKSEKYYKARVPAQSPFHKQLTEKCKDGRLFHLSESKRNFKSFAVICRKPHVASSICLRATIFQNPEWTLWTHCTCSAV